MRESSHSGSQAVGTGHSDQVRARYDPQGYVILQRQTVGLTVRKVRLGVLYRNCALCKIAGDHAAAWHYALLAWRLAPGSYTAFRIILLAMTGIESLKHLSHGFWKDAFGPFRPDNDCLASLLIELGVKSSSMPQHME